MRTRLVLCLIATVLATGCVRNREIEKELKLTDIRTGWYDAGIVEFNQNKLVPSISLRLQNDSNEEITGVQINAIFRRVNEQQVWGEHFIRAIGSEGLPGGATGDRLVLRSPRGYTGSQSRLNMLENKEFIDAKVDVFGKHGSRQWVKIGEFQIDRQLLTE